MLVSKCYSAPRIESKLKCLDYIDSADQTILSFDYSSGKLENQKVIARTPPPLAPATDAPGVFDGLCTDGVGNIWAARWSDGRVVGYTPEGEIICNINVPEARNVTIPCFGGKFTLQYEIQKSES